ncbi:MAG: ATP-binding protein [Myxococcota bacterium]
MLEPSARAIGHLRAELRWVRSVLELRLRQLQRVGRLPSDGERFPGTSISPREIDARLGSATDSGLARPGTPEAEAAERVREALRAREAIEAADPAFEQLPLQQIRRAFSLDDDEYFLLLLSLGPEFDPTLPRLCAFLQNHFERQYPTLALVADCLSSPDQAADLRHLLDPAGTLRASGLLRIDEGRPTTPLMSQAILAEPRIVRFVEGQTALDPALTPCCTLERTEALAPPILDAETEATYERMVASATAAVGCPWDLPVYMLRGPDGVGKRRFAAGIAAGLGMRLLAVDLVAMRGLYSTVGDGLRVVLREGRLQQAVVHLHGWEQLIDVAPIPAEGQVPDPSLAPELVIGRTLALAVETHPGVVCLGVAKRDAPAPRLPRRIETIDIPVPTAREATRLWDRMLPAARRGDDAGSATLAEAYDLTPGQILAAVREAEQRVAASAVGRPPRLSGGLLRVVVRDQIRTRLGDVATLIEPAWRWDDLVVSRDVSVQLLEFINRHRYRSRVLDEWGLGRRFGHRIGLSALFEGPSGTGKTMTASLVAQELGLNLYQIELSKVVSRWLGETEKMLGRIFDEAERGRVMLLFDEADSLFSKRTSVQSSNDRYANLEVNYLLQRVEHFTGVAVLTTNFPESLDDAFKRRLSVRVTFPRPLAAERERLWQTMLSEPRLPRAADVDVAALARTFELSGGLIRNAVLRAAFMAASRERPLDQSLLSLAARIEMREQGLLVQGSPHDDLAALVGPEGPFLAAADDAAPAKRPKSPRRPG